MSLTILVTRQLIIMLLLIITGFTCRKIGLITTDVNKKLSSLVLNLVNPMIILTSYQMKFKQEYIFGLFMTFVLAAVSVLMSILLAQLVIRKSQKNDVVVERFSIIYSNCGFIGIPLINSMFGAQGVFYLTSYITVFNLLVWTHGVILMKGEFTLSSIKNIIRAPAVIATVVGMLLFLTRITIPDVIKTSMDYIGSMNTPLAMLVAGATIAETHILKAFTKLRVYFVGIMKLIIVPLITVLIFKLFTNVDHTVLLTVATAAACPTAATGTLFAINYNKNSLYASEIFAVTTLLSVITLPLTSLLFNFLL